MLALISLVYLATSTFVLAARHPTVCPALPNPLPEPTDLPEIPALPDPFKFFNNETVRTREDWLCRRKELLTFVQEYMYGYYPDHSKEKVTATRNGSSVSITVSAGGKSGTFAASIELPTNVVASPRNKVPVVISAGGVNDTAFIGSGVALATFNLPDVAADSITPGGVFWELYSGRDIGKRFLLHAVYSPYIFCL